MKIRYTFCTWAGLAFASMSFAQTLPAGFSSTLVAAVSEPTAIAFVPDGRMLITSQSGSLRVFQNGSLVSNAAISFNPNSTGAEPKICTGGEQGLLGVAVDPLFASNSYIYLFYTARNGSNCGTPNYQSPNYNAANQKVNRVSRFVLGSNNVVNPTSETILVDRMPARGTNHNAGDLHFGKDGYLYISIGDGGTNWTGSGSAGGNDAARDKYILTGKILRITRDGGIPPGNPFTGAGTGRCNTTGATTIGNHCQETFAWGLRNPFRFAMDPNAIGTRFYINDVGQGEREEVSEGESGADYGWNCREGSRTNSTSNKCSAANSPLSTLREPVYEYPHDITVPGTSVSGCNSITGGAFVPNGVWPAAYDGQYLIADYVCGAIFRIATNGVPKFASEPAPTVPITSATDFATNLGGSSATSLRFGPFGNGTALYYTSYVGSNDGVYVISYLSSGNNAPTVSALTATPQSSASAPLTTTLQATASDPDANNTLRYFWDFGDGTTSDTATASTQKTYNANGVYVVSVRARDNNFAFSAARSVTVQVGNTPPTPSIATPSAVLLYAVGQTITLAGGATDVEDGTLPVSALTWNVILHHDTHTHPFLTNQVGNNIQFTAPAPEDLSAATNSYLEIRLTATDSAGLSTTISRNIQPNKQNLTVRSTGNGGATVTGLKVSLNGTEITTPQTVTTWQGWQLPVIVADQNRGTNGYRFNTWSDGGARSHEYNSPNGDSTLTVNFNVGNFVPLLDVDNNGVNDAATDGVLLMRYLLGFRDATLIAGNAVGANAERTTASAIADYLTATLASFNVDGRAGTLATGDGVIAIRYLLGLSGAPLTAGTGATNDPNTVKSALDALAP
jgi:glucose/arabinose dehydrogenase/chitodextrinase